MFEYGERAVLRHLSDPSGSLRPYDFFDYDCKFREKKFTVGKYGEKMVIFQTSLSFVVENFEVWTIDS